MDIEAKSSRLEAHFRKIHAERMRGLPILNSMLEVRAVGFQAFDKHAVGVLITPWFMNLVLLPGTSEWSECAQGSLAGVAFPGGNIQFNVSHDDDFGTQLSAALFSSVRDFPDQDIAEGIAREILHRLFQQGAEPTAAEGPTISRRELFARLGARCS